ncbi:MAG: cobalamin-binding protein [Chloroflexi bacterium]|nr:cobalamin-binding protein [Chloroflexota bacterium]
MSRKLFFSIVGMLVLVAIFSAGCAAPVPPTPTLLPSTPSPTPLPFITLADDAGRTVILDRVPQRIVTLAPNLTEIVFALGLGDRLVGVSDYSNYPPEAQEIQSVGGFPLNIELIVSLEPDLVLAAGITSLEDVARLEELGLTVLYLNPTDVEGILDSILVVGRASGAEDAAAELVAELRERMGAVVERVAQAEIRPRVYYEIDPTLYTGAPGSFTHELITLAGGENLAEDAITPYPQLSAEQIIAADPQIIIFSHAKYGGTAEQIASRSGWEVITAVKNGAIHAIDPDLVDRPGPRIIDGLEVMARLIHPELFGA